MCVTAELLRSVAGDPVHRSLAVGVRLIDLALVQAGKLGVHNNLYLLTETTDKYLLQFSFHGIPRGSVADDSSIRRMD